MSPRGGITVSDRAIAHRTDRRPWSVRTYLLLIVAVAAGLLLVSGVISTVIDFRDARRNARRAAVADAELLAKDLSESVATARTTVQQTLAEADLATVAAGAPSDCSLAGSAVGVFSSANLHILNPNGDILCSSAEGVVGEVSYSGMDWFRVGADADAAISEPFLDPVTSRRAVAVAGAVVDTQGEAVGSFAVVLGLEEVAEALMTTRAGQDSIEVTLVDLSSGEILSSSEAPDASGTSVTDTAFASIREDAAAGLDGTQRLYGSSSLEEPDWQVVAGRDEEAAVASARSAMWRRSGFGLAILALLLVVGGFIYRRIARPITELSSGIRAAGEVPSPEPIEIKGPAEVVHLADEYNSMIRTRAQYENRMIQAQKMDAVGQVAGGIAHDFNNLLAAIISYAHLLGEQLQGDPKKDDADQIVRAAERGTALIRRLLSFSRREGEQPRVVSVATAVGASAKLLRQVIRENISLDLVVDPDCWNVFIDPVQFEQVLVNLVVNARDAMPSGGTITITAENRSDEVGREMVALSIADSGAGIDPEIRDRIFEPFFTTKAEDRGTGLGLAVVSQIVNQAGGSIEVASERNVGTVVTILLPRETADEERIAAEPEDVPQRSAAGRTILVVEDEEIVRDSTVRILETHDFTVLPAGSGTEALDVLRGAGPVDLLLTDLVMPDMSGITLAAQAGLPVLFMSGYADSQLRNSGLTIASHHIEKPFSPRDLLAAIHRVLDEPR